jgi:hypothetical protein
MDKGRHYTNFQFPADFHCYGGRIAVHPTNPKIIMIAGSYRYDKVNDKRDIAVARTTDGGASWTVKRFTNSADSGCAHDVVFAKANPNYVYVCGYDYKNNANIARAYISKNGGSSWTSVATPAVFDGQYPVCNAIYVDAHDPKKAWVAHLDGIARTTNAGASWKAQETPQIKYVTSITADSSNSKILYAGGKYGSHNTLSALKSTDGGVTWKASSDGLMGESRRILAAGSKVHLASEVGIFLSKNGGSTWNPSHAGICGSHTKAFAVSPSSPNTLYAGIAACALFKTANGGSAWTTCGTFDGSDSVASVAVHPTDSNAIYIKPSG